MSKIEVNQIDVQCGSTLTVGSSGKTVSLAPGASQTGFGRTGTVDWCTTAKTGPFTAVSGDGFFVNTNGGAITVTLPSSPSQGDIVAFKDYNNTWDDACKAVTLCRNGSKINGVCANTNLTTQSQSVTLIYVDGTKGWQDIHDSTSNVSGNPGFIVATGGTESTSGDYKIHKFTGDGTFSVSNVGLSPGVGTKVSYMVVAGGGGGSTTNSGNSGGAGGAGGFREGKFSPDPYTASPLAQTPCSGLEITATSFPIVVGGGGPGGPTSSPYIGTQGGSSTFSSITSAGGGSGGTGDNPSCATARSGNAGGSGGGSGGGGTGFTGGAGNTPPVAPPQGNAGGGSRPSPGPSHDSGSGGGGGAGAAGNPSPAGNEGGAGGAHVNSSIDGSDTEYAGGSGGVGTASNRGTPGGGGAGNSAQGPNPFGTLAGAAGTANTGGSGGGNVAPNPNSPDGGYQGGSGVVIIRYKFQ